MDPCGTLIVIVVRREGGAWGGGACSLSDPSRYLLPDPGPQVALFCPREAPVHHEPGWAPHGAQTVTPRTVEHPTQQTFPKRETAAKRFARETVRQGEVEKNLWGGGALEPPEGGGRGSAKGSHFLAFVKRQTEDWRCCENENKRNSPHDTLGAHRALCPRCAKSGLFWTHFPRWPRRLPRHRTTQILTQSNNAIFPTENAGLLSESAVFAFWMM